MPNKALISLLLLIVVAGLITFFYVGGKPNIVELKKSVAPAASLYPESKSVADQLNFINDDSDSVHLTEISQGKWALLYFGYTSCPDVCPIDLSKINMTYQLMENKEEMQVVFISVDPERDIGKLDKFASAFNTSFLGLTAYQNELISISKTLGVYHEVVESQKLAQEDHSNHGDHDGTIETELHEDPSVAKIEHYDIDHTSSYLLFSPELKLTALLTSPHEPMPMAKAIDKIIEALR